MTLDDDHARPVSSDSIDRKRTKIFHTSEDHLQNDQPEKREEQPESSVLRTAKVECEDVDDVADKDDNLPSGQTLDYGSDEVPDSTDGKDQEDVCQAQASTRKDNCWWELEDEVYERVESGEQPVSTQDI